MYSNSPVLLQQVIGCGLAKWTLGAFISDTDPRLTCVYNYYCIWLASSMNLIVSKMIRSF